MIYTINFFRIAEVKKYPVSKMVHRVLELIITTHKLSLNCYTIAHLAVLLIIYSFIEIKTYF